MMKRLLWGILIVTLSVANVFGEDNKIKYIQTGSILNAETEEPLEFATVTALSFPDSTFVTGTAADLSGNYTLNLRPGKYILKYQFISFLPAYKSVEVAKNVRNIKIEAIRLTMNQQSLEEVVVSGKKENLEFSLDKRAYNVGENVSNLGKSAAAILDNIPSVNVDIEGNVSLRGSENVNILVDGKPSGLVGLNSQAALRQLQGNMIEKIEVITNPSARYEAEGTAGIINIVLKKESRKGVNGTFGVDLGQPSNYALSANLNARTGKVNFFVGGGVQYRKYNGFGNSDQFFQNADTSYQTLRDRTHRRGGLSGNLRFGADYFINDKNTLTTAMILKSGNEQNETNLQYLDFDGNQTLIETTDRVDNEEEDESYVELSLNYEKKFNKKDHTLTFYTQFRDNSEIESSDIEESNSENFFRYQRSNNEEGSRNFLVKGDYVHPFTKDRKFEAGFQSNYRVIRNDYIVDTLDLAGIWQTDPAFTNDFEYTEFIPAFYAIFGDQPGKFSYQFGGRIEITDITTHQITTEERNDKNYTNFFPSAHLTYNFDENKKLQVSYSRRMRRPRFRSLNPFSSISDLRNIRVGNPDLDPELSDSYEAGYLRSWDKSSFYGGVYYTYTDDVIQRITQPHPDDDGILISKPVNLSTRDRYGFEFNISKDITDWWKMDGNFNFFQAYTEGSAEGRTYNAEARSWRARVNTQIKLPADIESQINLNYRGPQNTTQGERLSFYTIDLGFTKDILQNKGTITASVQDLFNTRTYRGITSGDGFISESEFQWRSRQFLFSFNYRLNQKKKRGRKGRNGGGDFDGGSADF